MIINLIGIAKKTIVIQWIGLLVLLILIFLSFMTYVLAFFGFSVDVVVATRLSFRAYILFFFITLYLRYIYQQRRDRLDHLLLANTILLVAILDCAGNALDLYQYKLIGIDYDKYLHFFSPMILMVGFGSFLVEKRNNIKEILHRLIFGALLLYLGAFAFEVYEYSSDLIIGTDMVHGINDTLGDLILGFLGITLGAIIVFLTVKFTNQFEEYEIHGVPEGMRTEDY